MYLGTGGYVRPHIGQNLLLPGKGSLADASSKGPCLWGTHDSFFLTIFCYPF